MMWAFRPRPRWQRRRGRQGRSCLEAGDSRLNFAPYCDVISNFRHAFGEVSPAGAPEGGLYLGAEPELPEGLRVSENSRNSPRKIGATK